MAALAFARGDHVASRAMSYSASGTSQPITTALRLAAEARVDPRTAMRAIRGERIRGQAGERVAAAMALLGIRPDHPPSDSPPSRAQDGAP
jgi:hypothetical protein